MAAQCCKICIGGVVSCFAALCEHYLLSRLCFQVWKTRHIAFDLALCQVHQGRQASRSVCIVEMHQVPAQCLKSNPLIRMVALARDLQPEQASQGILKDAEVTCVHRIDGNVLDGESWAPEDGRCCTPLHVRAMVEECLPMAGTRSKVCEHMRAGFACITLPTELIRAW